MSQYAAHNQAMIDRFIAGESINELSVTANDGNRRKRPIHPFDIEQRIARRLRVLNRSRKFSDPVVQRFAGDGMPVELIATELPHRPKRALYLRVQFVEYRLRETMKGLMNDAAQK